MLSYVRGEWKRRVGKKENSAGRHILPRLLFMSGGEPYLVLQLLAT
jgi:hypothetical protein